MQWSDSGATVERRWSGSGDDATSPGRSAFRSSKCTTSTLSGCAAAASHQPRCHSQMLPDSTRPARKSGANCSHPPTKQKPGMLRVWCSIDGGRSYPTYTAINTGDGAGYSALEYATQASGEPMLVVVWEGSYGPQGTSEPPYGNVSQGTMWALRLGVDWCGR